MKSLLIGLAIIFCVLIGNIANAQCAWVLWLKHCSFITKSGENMRCEWTLEEAYPIYEQCMKARENSWTGYKQMFPKSEGVPFGYLNLSKESEKALTINFHCFPDTVDPRK